MSRSIRRARWLGVLFAAALVAACSVAPAASPSPEPTAALPTPSAAPPSGESIASATPLPAFTAASPFPAVLPTPQYPSSDANFKLALNVPAGPQHAKDAIDLTASLTYIGPEKSITVVGDSDGMVGFYFVEVGGTKILGFASRLMCGKPIVLERGVARAFTPPKSAAFDENDPNAAFYRQWVSDPQVHLTPGHWEVGAIAMVWNGTSCYEHDADHKLQTGWASIEVLA